MSWPFDTTEPLVAPELTLALSRKEHGLTPDNDTLPPVLVATFQQAAYDRMLERAGATDGAAGHGGSGATGSRAVGQVAGVPVALARITVGAPAAALVLEMAIARGVRTILVAGSAGSLQPDLPLGSSVVVDGAEREDGTSHHYLPAGEVVTADPVLTDLLETGARARGLTPIRGRSWTIDAPYRETVGAIRRHRNAGVAVVEMEAAAIFALARVRGVRAGLLVAVSDELFDAWNPGFRHPSYLEALVRAADTVMDVAATVTVNLSQKIPGLPPPDTASPPLR
ncbi:MAG: nucleoside phosphorylase [Chloroflexota bacterium]